VCLKEGVVTIKREVNNMIRGYMKEVNLLFQMIQDSFEDSDMIYSLIFTKLGVLIK